MPTKSWKNHPKQLHTYGSWEFFFSAASTAQNSPELHFRFINSFIQPSLVESLALRAYCPNLYAVIQGVIFDSCPGKLSIKSFFNTMGFVLGGNVLRRKTIPFFYFVYFIWTKLLRIILETDTKSDPMFWWDGYYELQNPGNSTLGLFRCINWWLITKCEYQILFFWFVVFFQFYKKQVQLWLTQIQKQ